jgi:hypothetical protein
MSNEDGKSHGGVAMSSAETAVDIMSVTVGLEQKLAHTLHKTAGEVSRLECLDEEQRAEVYAILGAIQNDTRIHCEVAAVLAKAGAGKAMTDA